MSDPIPTTFEEWHKANAKYMEPADMVPWAKEAWDAALAAAEEVCRKNYQNWSKRSQRWQHHQGAAYGADHCADDIAKMKEKS